MSDQPGPVPPSEQPPQTPPPGAGAPYPQAPYPQQPPAYAPAAPAYPPPYPPAQPPAPAKKRRTWVWVALVVFLLLCCGGVAVAGLVGYGVKTASDQASAVKAADTAYMKAIKSLQSASTSAAAIGDAEAPDGVGASLESAKSDLAAARAAVEGMPSSDGRTVYLQGLDQADAAVETLGGIVSEASGKSKFLATAKEGISLYDQGSSTLNSAVQLANKNLYSRSGVLVGKSKLLFKQARAKLVEADNMEKGADLEKSVAYVDLQLEKVDLAIQLDNYGSRGQISQYNKVVPKFNAINTKIGRAKEPDALSDPNWATSVLTDLQAKFTEQLTKSGELVDRAHAKFGGSGS